jgi:hypothetical protein
VSIQGDSKAALILWKRREKNQPRRTGKITLSDDHRSEELTFLESGRASGKRAGPSVGHAPPSQHGSSTDVRDRVHSLDESGCVRSSARRQSARKRLRPSSCASRRRISRRRASPRVRRVGTLSEIARVSVTSSPWKAARPCRAFPGSRSGRELRRPCASAELVSAHRIGGQVTRQIRGFSRRSLRGRSSEIAPWSVQIALLFRTDCDERGNASTNATDQGRLRATRKPMIRSRKSARLRSRVAGRSSQAGYIHEPPRSTRRQSLLPSFARPSFGAPV